MFYFIEFDGGCGFETTSLLVKISDIIVCARPRHSEKKNSFRPAKKKKNAHNFFVSENGASWFLLLRNHPKATNQPSFAPIMSRALRLSQDSNTVSPENSADEADDLDPTSCVLAAGFTTEATNSNPSVAFHYSVEAVPPKPTLPRKPTRPSERKLKGVCPAPNCHEYDDEDETHKQCKKVFNEANKRITNLIGIIDTQQQRAELLHDTAKGAIDEGWKALTKHQKAHTDLAKCIADKKNKTSELNNKLGVASQTILQLRKEVQGLKTDLKRVKLKLERALSQNNNPNNHNDKKKQMVSGRGNGINKP